MFRKCNFAINMETAQSIKEAQELARSGQYEKAANICRDITGQQPQAHVAWHLLGVLHNLGGRPAEALNCIAQAIAIQPDIAKYHLNLGNACLALDDLPGARSAYEEALRLDGNSQDAHYNLALLLRKIEEAEKAEMHFQRATQGPVPMPEAWAQLAAIQEAANRLEAAANSVASGLALAPDNPLLSIVEAKLQRRSREPEKALATLSRISGMRLPPHLAVSYHHEKGLLQDLLGQTEQAFDEFVRANEALFDDPVVKSINPANYLQAIEQLADSSLGESWRPADAEDEAPAPVFLVGFPRSGTTLLDQILDSHPSIQTLEEKPILFSLMMEFETLAGDIPPDRALRRRMQTRYFELVSEHIGLGQNSVLVDKFPLNISRVPLIVRIFPNARFILALRHPLDVCLSCFMQPFEPNEAMLNFARLDTTAQLYHHTMRLWLRAERELGLPVHRIRYEDLVDNFDGEVGRLLEFMGLPWDERVRGFAAHAAGRGRINTPSYQQVTRPLNRDAVYRWKRYERQLAPIVPVLAPYVREFCYESEVSGLPQG